MMGKKYLWENICLFSLFVLIFYFICHISDNGSTHNEFISYEATPLLMPGMNKAGIPPKNDTFIRIFLWKNPQGKKVITQLNISMAAHKNELRKFGVPPAYQHHKIIERRGFKIIATKNVWSGRKIVEKILSIVDYRKVFFWSLEAFPPITEQLLASSQLQDKRDPLYHLLRFVQYIEYKRPPKNYRSRFINNFFTPIVCLFEQYGDCDTKSLLLAELLSTNAIKTEKTVIVLIKQPGLTHAILAVKRPPLPGMTSLFFPGKGYFIVLEASSPGWAPGFIAKRVMDGINSGRYGWMQLY
jgi:hypothetical protein